jgi:hypothetical protein
MKVEIYLYYQPQFLHMNFGEEKKYWESLGVSFRKYKEQWQSNYKYALNRYLKKFEPMEVQDIVTLFELHDSSELEDIDKGLTIFCAFEFCRGKKKFIKEYFSKFNEAFGTIEKENQYLAILKLYKKHPESLKNILIYYYWRLTKTAKVFSPDVKIEIDHINKLKKKINSITSYLSKHNLRKYRFVPFGILEEETIFIFQIDRQTGDKIKRNIEGVIRDKSVSEFFLELDIEKQNLKIKGKLELSESIISNLIISIERALNLKLIEYDEIIEEERYSYAKFKEALKTPLIATENEIKVTNLTFNRTKLPNAIPLELSRTSKRIDIKASINQLIENDFVSLTDIHYIDSFYIEYENKQRKITVIELEETGEILLKLNDSGLSDDDKSILKEKFLNQFGLPVDIPINPKEITKNFDKRIEYLLNPHHMLDPPRPIQIEDLRILNKKGLIRTRRLQRVRCSGCGFGNIEPIETKNCPECEEELRKIDDVIQVYPDKNGIKKYIIQLFTNEGLEIVNKNAIRKFSKKPINLIGIRYEGRKIFFYIAYKGVNRKLLQYFQRASTPFFIIHIGHSTCRDLIDENLFSQVRLSELINFEVEGTLDNFFSQKLEEQLTYSSSQINRSAIKSAKIIKGFLIGEEEYSYDNLEDDTFNILKEIFQNSEKWGKEFIGVPAPEGISGFTFKDGDKFFNISFSWDCKFTETDSYNINNMNEVRKARDYIKKAIHSPSLKSFSKKLNAYFIISNDIKFDDFQKYSEKVLKVREKSKPTINLFDLDAIYELHRLYHKYNEDVMNRENIFLKHLFNTIVKKPKKASFKHLNRQEIIKIFKETLESNIEVELLDTVGIMESMEEDII